MRQALRRAVNFAVVPAILTVDAQRPRVPLIKDRRLFLAIGRDRDLNAASTGCRNIEFGFDIQRKAANGQIPCADI